MRARRALAAGWQYAGYRMTVFSNDEERWVEDRYMGGREVPFFVNDALSIAGGNVEISGQGIFKSHVVQDRELITGQNCHPMRRSLRCLSKRSSASNPK